MSSLKESRIIGYPNLISYESTVKIKEQMEKIFVKLILEMNKEQDFFVKYHFQIKII